MKNFLLKSEFKRNVFTLIKGSTLAQTIPIIITPIIARLYTTDEFGVLELYTSLFVILSIIATGRYELAIMTPKKDEDGENICYLSIFITLIFSTLCLLIVIIFNKNITNILKEPSISFWLYLLPLSIFFTGVYQNLNYLSNRKKKYNVMALAKVIQSGTTSGMKLLFGILKYSSGGLILGLITGQFAGMFIFIKKIFFNRKKEFSEIKNLKVKNIKKVAKDYIEHPKYLIISHSLASFYMQIPIFFINNISSVSTVGLYSMAYKLTYLPVILIANSISDVFRQEATEYYHRVGVFDKILLKTFWRTFTLSIIPFILAYFYIDDMFRLFLGEKWLIAGQYAKIMIIYSFFSFIVIPVDKAALIINKTTYLLAWHIFRFISTIIVVCISYFFHLTIDSFLYGLVIVNGLSYIINLFFQYKFSKTRK